MAGRRPDPLSPCRPASRLVDLSKVILACGEVGKLVATVLVRDGLRDDPALLIQQLDHDAGDALFTGFADSVVIAIVIDLTGQSSWTVFAEQILQRAFAGVEFNPADLVADQSG